MAKIKCHTCNGKGSISAGKGIYGLYFCDDCGGKGYRKSLIVGLSEESKRALMRLLDKVKSK